MNHYIICCNRVTFGVVLIYGKPLSAKKAIKKTQVNFDTFTAYHLIKENYLKTI